jgi:hypothetical protein
MFRMVATNSLGHDDMEVWAARPGESSGYRHHVAWWDPARDDVANAHRLRLTALKLGSKCSFTSDLIAGGKDRVRVSEGPAT